MCAAWSSIYQRCPQPSHISIKELSGAKFEHVTDKGRTALITLISNHIQRVELEELEDEGMSDLLHLQDKMFELQVA